MAPPYNIPSPMAKRDPNWWKKAKKKPPTQDQINAWSDARSRATLLLGGFRDKVLAKCGSWEIAAHNIGSAYATAAGEHKGALAKQDKIDALKIQAIFSVLTVATSGAFSWVCAGLEAAKAAQDAAKAAQTLQDVKLFNALEKKMARDADKAAQALQERQWLNAAVQGGLEAGIGEGFSAMGPVAYTPDNSPLSIDPQVFQNTRENAVIEARDELHESWSQIQLRWARAPLEIWNDYDEQKQMAEFNDLLRKGDTLAGDKDLPSVTEMAEELERGIWAAWMPKLKTNQWYTTAKDDMKFKEDYEGLGSEIEARLEKLGILKMADVTIHWYQRAATEDRKLIAWAQGYKVKEFQSIKKK
jgi:hypothetical protein